MVEGRRKMRQFRWMILAFVLVGFLAGSADGKEFCNSAVIKSWEQRRDETAVSIIKLFLRQASPKVIQERGFELLRTEVLLSPCVPPLRLKDFYLLDLKDPDPDLLPMAVLRGYLRKHRVPIEARDFFVGTTFWLESKGEAE